jgi:hypothetical protein
LLKYKKKHKKTAKYLQNRKTLYKFAADFEMKKGITNIIIQIIIGMQIPK